MLMPGHTFLYSPPVREGQAAARRRRARRAVLRDVQPREPRHPPERRQRRPRPRAARLQHPPLLVRQPDLRARRRPRLGRLGPARRRVHRPRPEERRAHPHGAVVARAHQAAPHRAGRQRQDGRLRGHEPGADPRLRPWRRDREPQSFGEYQLSYRSGDMLTPRLDAAEPLRVELRGLRRLPSATAARPRRIGASASRSCSSSRPPSVARVERRARRLRPGRRRPPPAPGPPTQQGRHAASPSRASRPSALRPHRVAMGVPLFDLARQWP